MSERAEQQMVLLVEDDADLRVIMTVILEHQGYRVQAAKNGQEALMQVAQEMPDLILLDMRMPVMNGWEFAEAFRAQYGQAAPVVVLTAARDAAARSAEIGADGFLGKPFELTALLGIVAEHTRLIADTRRTAARDERQRLVRNLHDSVMQSVYSVGLLAAKAQTEHPHDAAALRTTLEHICLLAADTLSQLRAMVDELSPAAPDVTDEGLVAALSNQVAMLQAGHAVAVHATMCAEPAAPPAVKEAVYRIAREALHNIVKHAGASQVTLRLDADGAELALEVQDNGMGFDPAGSFPGQLGLRSMRERATELGGSVLIDSAPGRGTRIDARIPYSQIEASAAGGSDG